MCYGFYNGFGGFGIVGMIIHLAFVALIIWGLIFLFKKGTEGTFRGSTHGGALEILNIRYAKGEIASEDYQRMKKELES